MSAHPVIEASRVGVKAILSVLDLYDTSLPASYAEGATPPDHALPPPPAAAMPEGLAQALDEPSNEAPALAPTPDGFEPGMMDDLLGMKLTRDNVEEVLDDMIRPALNADGGDITLVDIKDNDVYVKLVGACSTCPSAVMTMRMGVERHLQEHFPDMRELIDVGA